MKGMSQGPAFAVSGEEFKPEAYVPQSRHPFQTDDPRLKPIADKVLAGERLNLTKIKTPAFFQAAKEDHTAPAPDSCHTLCVSWPSTTSSPGRVSSLRAIWLAIVPLGTNSAASLPNNAAMRS